MNDRSRPKAAPETPTKKSDPIVPQCDSVALDYAHAGDLSGFDRGFAQGARFADEDRVQEILHQYACRMAGIAVRTARAHWGDGWASLIERQASGVDW